VRIALDFTQAPLLDVMIWAVQESVEPDRTVSIVARQHDVNPNQLFHWRSFTRTAACRL
jgi:hypothetical protein